MAMTSTLSKERDRLSQVVIENPIINSPFALWRQGAYVTVKHRNWL
jgi:hypothetical protein